MLSKLLAARKANFFISARARMLANSRNDHSSSLRLGAAVRLAHPYRKLRSSALLSLGENNSLGACDNIYARYAAVSFSVCNTKSLRRLYTARDQFKTAFKVGS